MQIIFNEKPMVAQFLRPADKEDVLVWSQFVMLTDVDGGCLAWNTFTCSLVFLPNTTANEVKADFSSLDCVDELRENHFLVSRDTDELKRLSQTRMLLDRVDISRQKFAFIFTTYACNARCPYCYESQIPISSMSEDTAYNVAKFLVENHDDKSIHIRWFGGEPMVNSKVIDIICSELEKNNVPFVSSMISNAYLFDEEKIKHAVEKWKLSWIQITLDGPQDVYNRIKNYVGDKPNAFEHVLNNIQLFTKNKVKVNVRFNVSNDNLENFTELLDVLEKRFEGNEYFFAYPKFLFDYYKPHSSEDAKKVIEACRILFDRLESKDMLMATTLKVKPSPRNCLADTDASYSILPNGKLNKCHHEQPLLAVGDVVNGIVDEELNDSFKERIPFGEKCKECVLAPNCTQLKKCAHKCNDVHKEFHKMWLEASIRMYYKKYKTQNN